MVLESRGKPLSVLCMHPVRMMWWVLASSHEDAPDKGQWIWESRRCPRLSWRIAVKPLCMDGISDITWSITLHWFMLLLTVWCQSVMWRHQVTITRMRTARRQDVRRYRNHNSRHCSDTRPAQTHNLRTHDLQTHDHHVVTEIKVNCECDCFSLLSWCCAVKLN